MNSLDPIVHRSAFEFLETNNELQRIES